MPPITFRYLRDSAERVDVDASYEILVERIKQRLQAEGVIIGWIENIQTTETRAAVFTTQTLRLVFNPANGWRLRRIYLVSQSEVGDTPEFETLIPEAPSDTGEA